MCCVAPTASHCVLSGDCVCVAPVWVPSGPTVISSSSTHSPGPVLRACGLCRQLLEICHTSGLLTDHKYTCGPQSLRSSGSLQSVLLPSVLNDLTMSLLVSPLEVPMCVRVAGWCRWVKHCGRTPTSSCASLWSSREPPRCHPLLVRPCAPCF